MINAGSLLESASTLLGVITALLPIIRLFRLERRQELAVSSAIMFVSIMLVVSVLSTMTFAMDAATDFLKIGCWTFFFGVLCVFGILLSLGLVGRFEFEQ